MLAVTPEQAAMLPTGDAERHGVLHGLQQKHGGLVTQMPGCREALARTRKQCAAYWPPGRCTNTTWQIFWSRHARIAYVKTAKAGSVSIKDYMYRHLGPITKLTATTAELPADAERRAGVGGEDRAAEVHRRQAGSTGGRTPRSLLRDTSLTRTLREL